MKKAIEMLRVTPSAILRRAKVSTIAQFAVQRDYDQLNRPHAHIIGAVVCPPPNGTGKLHKVEARLYAPAGTISPTWVSCDCGNFRYCVTGDTLINTEEGLIPIEHLEEMKLQALTLTGSEEARVIPSNEATTLKIRTSRGFELRATENELLLVLGLDLELEWKRVDELVAGDYVTLQPGTSRREDKPVPLDFEFVPNERPSYFRRINGRRTKVSGHTATNYKVYQVPSELTSDLAGVLGYLVAEGSTDHNTISFPQKDAQVMDDYLTCWASCFPDSDLTANKETNGTPIAEIRSVYLVQFLQQIGYDPDWRSGTKQVPEIIFRAQPSVIHSFLRRMFEGDGWCTKTQVGYDSDSTELIKQVQQLLFLFGVVTSRSDTSLWCGGIYAQRFCERIGFVSDRKNAALTLDEVAGRTIPHVHGVLRDCIKRGGYYEIDGRRERLSLHSKTLQRNEARAGGMYERTVRKYLDDHPDFQRAYPGVYEHLSWLLQSNCEWDSVEEAGHPETRMTYDAVVPAAEHFVGNGFVVHNTWEVADMLAHSSSVKYSNGALPNIRNPQKVTALCKHLARLLSYATRARKVSKVIFEIPAEEIKRVKPLMKQRGVPQKLPRRQRPQLVSKK